MNIIIPKEPTAELRVPLLPQNVERLVKKGATIIIESGLGAALGISDAEYKKAGASLEKNRRKLLAAGDTILRLRKPEAREVRFLKKGSLHVSYLDPFNEPALLGALAKQKVSAISMEMIPRSTRAQKMDALSSQASLAGYAAVILAADNINKIFPMMMTPAGTLQPSKVFIIGAGVAGLQAIATARRLGARVDAFDTRPIAKNDVLSLGAKFVEVDLGETGQTAQGYAKALTEEQLKKQRETMKQYCAQSDIVITTAQIFGRKAPVIVTTEMIDAMKPGSVVVDLAVETGGNVEGAVLGKIIEKKGVKIIGMANMPARVAMNASQMYANNLTNLVEEFWNKEKKIFELKPDDDIIKGCLITHGGRIVHPNFVPQPKEKKSKKG
ncbi:MAG: Re/Si-specific NAD(P)(+) transhydrogenase subunit alpha [Ignavibacteriae bacterium]|nr:MAG: Re/Si-specific NAD(P)(+) transhydrogenase subunit alpha [Ignavibacteriota bacterium]